MYFIILIFPSTPLDPQPCGIITQSTLLSLVIALLGLGAYRTVEKSRSVQNNH